MDKTKKLSVTLELSNDKVGFQGTTEGQLPVPIDYVPPVGDGMGYTSLELLLMSLSSCMATSLLLFLRRSGKTITGLRIRTEADRRTEHPTILTQIHVRYFFNSPDLAQEDFEKVLALTEEKFCPVFAMINPATQIISTCHISHPGTETSHRPI
jgi:putative redox protein